MEIKFEWALDSLGDAAKVIHIGDAIRGGKFYCPDCKGEMCVKKGLKRTHHFAHYGVFNCTGESAEHAAAKARIVQVLNDWKADELKEIHIYSERYNDTEQFLASDRSRYDVKLEFHMGSQRRADVMILIDGEALLAIEVHQTHTTEEKKAEDYKAEGISWIEVEASEILDNPYIWRDIAKKKTITFAEVFSSIPRWVKWCAFGVIAFFLLGKRK